MKKLILMLMASLLVASTAFAVVDQDPNMLGIYFDGEADVTCVNGLNPYEQVTAFVCLTNPDFSELFGFEFGYDIVGSALVLDTAFSNPEALDVGANGNHIVGFGSPSPTAMVTPLAALTILYSDTTMAPVSFNITGTNPSSNDLGLPTMLLDGGVLMTTGYSTIDGVSAAVINGVCEDVVATDEVTFDSIKSLYR